MNIYVPGKGNRNPRIVFVGESPSFDEEQTLTPFTGPSGKFFNTLLSQVGINRDECWVTNACKYMVPANPKKGKKTSFRKRAESVGINLDQQYDELHNEIMGLKPTVIVPLGSTALHAITGKGVKRICDNCGKFQSQHSNSSECTSFVAKDDKVVGGIQSWRGSIISGMGYKCVSTYHPAHILHQDGDVKGYWHKEVMLFDLKRALKQSEFKEIRLPRRNINICKSSWQLEEFLKKYKDHSFPSIDIEAHKCIPIMLGIAFTPSESITIPLWEQYSSMSRLEIVRCWYLLSSFLSTQSVIGQNFGYDRDKIARLGFAVKSLYSDTMYKSFALNPELPKSLAFNTSIHTEEPYYKDEGMYEGSIEDLMIGCGKDCCVTKEIDISMQHDIDEMGLNNYYRNFILPLHELYAFNETNTAIEQVGFRCDEDVRKELIRKYIEKDEQQRHELFVLTKEYINTGSPTQVAKLIYETLKLPIRQGTGEEVLISLLNNSVKDPVKARIVELVLENRRVKKTLDTYLYALPDFDGRMKSTSFVCLETGRSSNGQQDAPIRPTVEYKKLGEDGKKVKKKQSRGMAFQTITKHGDIGQDIRKFLVPDEGMMFIQGDLGQAEARVIFKLAGDDEALELIDKIDYHALTASWFFGGTWEDHSKAKNNGKETPIRFCGKTLRHACHLGASKRRAAITVNTEARKNKIDFRISEQAADRAIKIFHSKQPKIRGTFHLGIQNALMKDGKLVAPVPYGIDAPIGGVRTFFERWGDELFRQAYSYIPQRTVSEHVKAAAIRIRKRASWILFVVEAHDALLCMVPIERKLEAAAIIKEELERPINFDKCTLGNGDLIIPVDLEEGMNYKDLGKFKYA